MRVYIGVMGFFGRGSQQDCSLLARGVLVPGQVAVKVEKYDTIWLHVHFKGLKSNDVNKYLEQPISLQTSRRR
jgi:hypothetical protein